MSHTISKSEVEKSAALGRLHLTAAEVTDATKKLDTILGYFSAIQTIDTTTVAMADDVSGLRNIAREDVVVSDALCTADTLLALTPAVHKNLIKVHAVFK